MMTFDEYMAQLHPDADLATYHRERILWEARGNKPWSVMRLVTYPGDKHCITFISTGWNLSSHVEELDNLLEKGVKVPTGKYSLLRGVNLKGEWIWRRCFTSFDIIDDNDNDDDNTTPVAPTPPCLSCA
jgi:hypothetical protein